MKKTLVALTALFTVIGFAAMGAADVVEDEDATVSGGEDEENDIELDEDVTDWAAFYGDVDTQVEFTTGDDETTYFQWLGEAQEGSLVHAVDSEVSAEDIEDAIEVTEEQDVSDLGLPEGGEQDTTNTYEGFEDPDSLDAPSEFDGDGGLEETVNLETEDNEYSNFLYATSDVDNPIFTAETEEVDERDYELLVGEDGLDEGDLEKDFYVQINEDEGGD